MECITCCNFPPYFEKLAEAGINLVDYCCGKHCHCPKQLNEDEKEIDILIKQLRDTFHNRHCIDRCEILMKKVNRNHKLNNQND